MTRSRLAVTPGKKLRNNRPAYGMVGAADGARHHAKRRFRIRRHIVGIRKKGRREHSRHTRILHTHLDSDGTLFGTVEPENLAHRIAQHVAEPVVAEHHREHQEEQPEAVRHQVRAHRHHHTANNQRKADDAYRRHVRADFLKRLILAEEVVAEEPDGYGRHGHVKDIEEHSRGVHVDARIGKPQHEQRGHDRRQERAYHRHAHRVRHVALRQETHHIARNTTRAATHENDAYRQVRVQAKNPGKGEGHERHDGVLCRSPEQDVEGALHQVLHVFHRDGKAHAEHDDAEDNGTHVTVDPAENEREEEGDDCSADNEKRCI